MVDGDRPLVIDLELACEVDPAWRCYDLTGPSAEVQVPEEHAVQGGRIGRHGVWWDAPLEGPQSLGSILGPVDGVVWDCEVGVLPPCPHGPGELGLGR